MMIFLEFLQSIFQLEQIEPMVGVEVAEFEIL